MVVNIVYRYSDDDNHYLDFIAIDGNGVVVLKGTETNDGCFYAEFGRLYNKAKRKNVCTESALREFVQDKFGYIVNNVIQF